MTMTNEAIEFSNNCPCCGYATLKERNAYEICPICWWEDDGQDNPYADEVVGGSNYHISLTLGRYHYITSGIYDPERTDLFRSKAQESAYAQGRVFRIIKNNTDEFLIEEGTDWKWKIIKKNST